MTGIQLRLTPAERRTLGTERDMERRFHTNRLGAKARLWFKQHGPDFDGYISDHEVELTRD